MISQISIQTNGQGLTEITEDVQNIVRKSGFEEGLCTLFVQHTSASLLIQENADPTAKRDLETWMNRLVPENDSSYSHTLEGRDDMPSHIKSAITSVSLGIPIYSGNLGLGEWQGIYLWEHRRRGHQRRVLIHIGK